MPLKVAYRAAVGLTPATYPHTQSAISRICGIYQTARTGAFGYALGHHLWTTFFSPLLNQLPQTPATQPVYDPYAVQHMLQLASILREHGRGDFGHAQKMGNLFMKDHWALNAFPAATELVLHLPLDRILLSSLAQVPAAWTAWTRVTITPATQPQILADYLDIQTRFRNHWKRTQRFVSPIEMETFIWLRIP